MDIHTGYEGNMTYHADQNLNQDRNHFDMDQIDNRDIFLRFKKFIREWQDSKNAFSYRTQLTDNGDCNNCWLQVDLDDLNNFDQITSDKIKNMPTAFYPLFEQAAKEVYAFERNLTVEQVPDFQIQITSKENPISLRDLNSNHIGKLVTVSGIITNTSRPQLKASELYLECKTCKDTIRSHRVGYGFGDVSIPSYCQKNKECGVDCYKVVAEESKIIDHQVLKLQENPEMLPTGEIPRTFQICVDRYLANRLIPGSRATVTGIYQVIKKKNNREKTNYSQMRTAYLYGLGFSKDQSRDVQAMFTPEDEEKFRQFSQDPKVYEKISGSIASAIYGSEDIKKAISCLLFGGSKKVLPDKTKLRGDINVLLIGDPSTAKSQLLKFVERIAPISVYTSGKGSSAAGLTASIIRDQATGEFQLEGGAMVLADGGIVCIDEFDKMKAQDRVAIHEAMEQQTISIAKAGITTVLNSRTSVLAAANPIFGRYDDLKQASEQIDLQTTILSRFDCIFIVRDNKSEEHDKTLANHIINLHQGKHNMDIEENAVDFNFLKKYIYYAKNKVSPRLTEESAQNLTNLYVDDRKDVQMGQESKKSHIPLTVRQLEAIIRLSESLAKMELKSEVTPNFVDEAHRIFKISTMNAIGTVMDPKYAKELIDMEDRIKKMVTKGSKCNKKKLMDDLTNRTNTPQIVEWAIINLIKKDEFMQVEGQNTLIRKK